MKLGATAEALYKAYMEARSVKARLAEPGRREILAALFYLCNPYDVIPDYSPGSGYLDDAIVINSCLAALRARSSSLYRRVLACYVSPR